MPRAVRPLGARLVWPAGTGFEMPVPIREDRRGIVSPRAGVDWRGAGADAGVYLRGAGADAGVDLRAAGAGEGSGESFTLLSLWQASAATIDHDIEKT